uniref:Conserved secreted protein n=1 Tax=Steinernema glaseri TaxID=37863 RepID=A0A1I8AET1_9BILA
MKTVMVLTVLCTAYVLASVQDFDNYYDLMETSERLAQDNSVWALVIKARTGRVRRSQAGKWKLGCETRFMAFVREVCGKWNCFDAEARLNRVTTICCRGGCSTKFLKKHLCCRRRQDIFFK